MSSRKPLSKRRRFDVFKRDSFTCCYCGRQPPVAILEVDHVVPVAEDGTDDLDNLATSCFDCNRGKSDVPLTEIPKSVVQARAEMVEREEQERAYIRFVKARRKRENATLLELAKALWGEEWQFTDRAATSARTFLERLPYDRVLFAAETAAGRFDGQDPRKWKYFCGICWRLINGDNRYGRFRT